MLSFLKSLSKDVRGTSAVEYAIICGILVIGLIFAMTGFAGETMSLWNDISTKSANAMS